MIRYNSDKKYTEAQARAIASQLAASETYASSACVTPEKDQPWAFIPVPRCDGAGSWSVAIYDDEGHYIGYW